MNIVEELDDCVKKLNEIDEYINTLVDELSNYDKRTTDLLHFIENNNLNAPQSCKIIKEIKKYVKNEEK